ncbi:hypothetical protein SK128_007057 [Halocaridina rubra]|uniref:Pentraxin (PTX) domain-containing protein n=1 Tax=Halocaridina rubra TaxID=373956 RepID=A0AAN8XHV8_HALRR
MVHFQASGPATTESMLAYKGTLKQLDEATFCFRLRIAQSRSTNSIFSYAVPDEGDEIHLSVNYKYQTLIFSCCDGLWEQETPMRISLREWLSICFSVNLKTWRWELVRNGEVKGGTLNITSAISPKIRSGGHLIIGQEQDSMRGGFNEFESLSGRLADLRLYDFILTTQQKMNYTMCTYFEEERPPIIDFANINVQYTAEKVTVSEITLSDTCNTNRNFDLVFPELRDFEAGWLLCNIAGGVLTLPTDSQYNEKLFNLSLPYAEACGDGFAETLWLGVKGDVATQKWLTHPESVPISYAKFDINKGLPIEEPELCMAFIGSKETVAEQYGLWVPSDCQLEMCPACHFDKVVIIRMRGLCEQSEFDRDYFLSHDQDSLSFTGVYYSEILKMPPDQNVVNSDYGYWILKRLDKPHVVAILPMMSPIHYPIGLNTWSVANDVCGQEKINLMMTSCQDYKFSCSDGTCINLQQRCDLETDCPDGTDEVGCYFLTLPKGYDGLIPPSRPDRSQPIKVYLYITLLSVRKIDLTNFRFVCELEVQLRWIDDRLIYHHLNFAETLNVVNNEDLMPWIPKMEFLGDGDTSSLIETRRSSLRIRRYSNPLPDNDENIYEGKSIQVLRER